MRWQDISGFNNNVQIFSSQFLFYEYNSKDIRLFGIHNHLW
jgi:hypothetical protein